MSTFSVTIMVTNHDGRYCDIELNGLDNGVRNEHILADDRNPNR